MKFALAISLLTAVNVAALPATPISTTAAPSAATHRPGFTLSPPVAAAETNTTVEDLGIAAAVITVPIKPNPDFVANVTNAILAVQAKYASLEQAMQSEKRALEEQQALEKRGRPGFVIAAPKAATTSTSTSVAAGRPGFQIAKPTTTSTTSSSSIKKSSSVVSSSARLSSSTATTSSTLSTSSSKSTILSTTSSVPSSSSSSSTKLLASSTTAPSSSSKPFTSSSTITTARPTTTSSLSSSTSSAATSTILPFLLGAQDIAQDSEYLSEITIGSNGNKLDVVMDTGSSDLWMFSTDCIACASSHDFYNPSISKTFVNTTTPFSISYGDGSQTSGIAGFDTVALAGLPIQAQSIDVAHHISTNLQANAMDGILGLGFAPLMSVSGVSTPLTNMINQKLIPAGMFGLQYIKSRQWTNSGGGGAWTFGGYDSSVISGALNTIPLVQAAYWMIRMGDIAIGSVYSTAVTQPVIIDSGTTLILLDATTVANIHTHLPGGTVLPSQTHYSIFCNASSAAYTGARNAYLTIGGVKYGIPAADLAWFPEPSDNRYCYSGIQPWGGSFGILGAMFLKNTYVVFDQTNLNVKIGKRSDLAALTD